MLSVCLSSWRTSPPAAQYELLELQRISGFVDRAKGLGRPTKKDRRDLDQFAEDMPEDLDLFDGMRTGD